MDDIDDWNGDFLDWTESEDDARWPRYDDSGYLILEAILTNDDREREDTSRADRIRTELAKSGRKFLTYDRSQTRRGAPTREAKEHNRLLREWLHELQGGRCALCGRVVDVVDDPERIDPLFRSSMDRLDQDRGAIDHIVARSSGGHDFVANLQFLCGTCNWLKGATTLEGRAHLDDEPQGGLFGTPHLEGYASLCHDVSDPPPATPVVRSLARRWQ